MTGPPRPAIRTPDQRIRVFVSSTLRELADERAAVRTAIEGLRLAPVMFELGARPHPPRKLYRAYLAQSDVFIGVYGDSYGWIAPGEEISGLEDEYRLAPPSMPKLIYIRRSRTREPRLEALIARIRADDGAAYLPFDSPDELADRVRGDLATMLAERFDQSRTEPDAPVSARLEGRVPAPYTHTIGREQDIQRIRRLLEEDADRVVSLVGPGGIGKSRLAIEVARACADLYPDGVTFVLLEGVFEPELLLPTIAYSLGVRDNGDADLEERIAQALEDRRVLLVLDNFEQIVDAAPILVRLYTAAPSVRFVVTSRVVLHIRGEQVYPVSPLTVPPRSAPSTLDRARTSPAVALFVDRARAIDPAFALSASNAGDVVDICRRLEGLPLAIELAAAKTRLLSPAALAERLEHALPLLSGAARDVPERHRTMRAAIEWSVGLLTDLDRDVLLDLSVFAHRFTLDAVEAIGAGRWWDGDALDALAGLVDASLVTRSDVEDRATFSLLTIVREYALDQLKKRKEADALRRAHADYYSGLVARISPRLRGPDQAEAVHALGLDLPNLRAAARHLVYCDRLDDAGEFAWRLFVYWWISGFFSEVRIWMLELLDKSRPIAVRTQAVAVFFTMWGEMWRRPSDQVIDGLGEASRLFTRSGDANAAAMALAARGSTRLRFPDADASAAEQELVQARDTLHLLDDWWSEAMTDVGLGLLALARGSIGDALSHFEHAARIGDEHDDAFTIAVAGNNLGRVHFFQGDIERAEIEYRRSLELAAMLHFDEGGHYAFEGLSAVAAARGDAWRAGALAAVAATLRRRVGVFDVEGLAVHAAPLAKLRATSAASVEAGERAGEEMTLREAFATAIANARESASRSAESW